MKVLFLDIDGVLNTPKMLGRFGIDFVDNILVALVARIVNETDCKIVLSSTWRIDQKDRMVAVRELAQYGLEIHSDTPVITRSGGWESGGSVRRAEEIQAWLDQNPVERFAILDDMQDACIEGSFFRTDENRGLTVQIAEQVIQHLLGDTN
jgi:hypothetical protein